MDMAQQWREITTQDLAALGVNDVAYIKQVDKDGSTGFAVCAANGRKLAMAPSYEAAISLIHQNEMEAATLH